MIIDILLIALALGSIGYVIAIAVRKFQHLANINVETIPEAKQARIRYQILEDTLKRDLRKRWKIVRDVLIGDRKEKVASFFSGFYQKLKELEQEYRLAGKRDLSSRVSTSQSVEHMLSEARKAQNEENYSRAEQLLIGALKLDEHNVKVYAMLADVYKAQGEYDHARQTLEYLLTLTHGSDASVYRRLATIAFERGDLHTAQDDYLKSISLDVNNYHYYLELAHVYTALGHHDKAQDASQKSLALAPNNPKILDFLVENSIVLQDQKQAMQYLERLREVNPQNGKLKSFGERIEALGREKK